MRESRDTDRCDAFIPGEAGSIVEAVQELARLGVGPRQGGSERARLAEHCPHAVPGTGCTGVGQRLERGEQFRETRHVAAVADEVRKCRGAASTRRQDEPFVSHWSILRWLSARPLPLI